MNEWVKDFGVSDRRRKDGPAEGFFWYRKYEVLYVVWRTVQYSRLVTAYSTVIIIIYQVTHHNNHHTTVIRKNQNTVTMIFVF